MLTTDTPLRVLALGWGVQSFTLAAMSALGVLPKLDYAVHCDTGHERTATYEFARQWAPWLEQHGIPVVTVPAGDGGRIVRSGGVAIPAFTLGHDGKASSIPRQCTLHWKIEPFAAFVRQKLGRRWRRGRAEKWLGISIDEKARVKRSRVGYIEHVFPLVEMRKSRGDCMVWLAQHGLPIPPKSACVFCPFQNNEEWLHVKSVDCDWSEAVRVDMMVRDVLQPPLFLHRSLRPLLDVDLRSDEERRGQLNLWQDECEGVCGF